MLSLHEYNIISKYNMKVGEVKYESG